MISIQKPVAEDVKGIINVFYKTWLVTYPNKEHGITTADVEEKYKDRFSEENIRKRSNEILNVPDDRLYFIAKDGDTVVGVCRAMKNEQFNELSAIYVLPEYQRRGIGLMLWEKVKEFLGSDKDLIVHVASYNQKAINFYKKMGFVETGKDFTKEFRKMPISGAILPEIELVIKATS